MLELCLRRTIAVSFSLLVFSAAWLDPGHARQSRFIENGWHGVDTWCELLGLIEGNKEIAQLRLGEVYVWNDLPKTTIGARCLAPAVVPGAAIHCEKSSLALASFELDLREDGSKGRLLRVMCIE